MHRTVLLKKIGGDLYEYWYDAENTRANMYYEHTNMMYTYDASDGRNRLVWMKDHKYNTTIYTYGAEGLQWGKCNENEYKIYHYDYRGSVVMVTDINGEKVDEIRYDTYGKVIARMATDRLVVGYNGRDGVLTDPTGILYMRNRYYSPELRRFMSADEISGSIADSSTLNVFAYVNGNPISFVDPFGLSKKHGQESSSSNGNSNWYGAAHLERVSVNTVEEEFDLTLGLNLLKIAYTQTVTKTIVHGTEGEWFGAYSYKDINADDITFGAGVDILYLLGIEVQAQMVGVGVTGALHFGETDVYIEGDINILNDISVSFGQVQTLDDGTQIDHNYAIKGNAVLVLSAVAFILTGNPVQTGSNIPSGQPA